MIPILLVQNPVLDSGELKNYVEIAIIVVLWLFSLYRTKLQVDGYGTRMKKYEDNQNEVKGKIDSFERLMIDANADRRALHEKFGELKKLTETCNRNIDTAAVDIRTAMETMGRIMTDEQHELELKFTELKAQFDTIERLRKEGRLNA